MDIFQKIASFLSPRTIDNPGGCGPQQQSVIVSYTREPFIDVQFALIKMAMDNIVFKADNCDDPLWALTLAGQKGMGSLTLDMNIGPPPVEADEFIRTVDPEADVPVTLIKKEKEPAREESKTIKDFNEWREARKASLDIVKVSEKLSERRERSRGNAEKPADKADGAAKQPKPKNKPKMGR